MIHPLDASTTENSLANWRYSSQVVVTYRKKYDYLLKNISEVPSENRKEKKVPGDQTTRVDTDRTPSVLPSEIY